ncbi:hypothetical protein K491DRAFT_691741 [Lophiostoma macrostomum CBS 122681]|uniref:Rhodopsin domain-containing protein n=1 Tax=Lophiostoma macrostomum CBS 122681 TaxID=1314788 RepID=A0A6A6T9S6_9PLEO|nr:hypothetical protein K491DRAFT_691741 [Lophiostoma macrostomum CBS 122681]
MRSIPPDVLLSWPTANYIDPVTRGPALVIVNSIFIALVVIVASLRLYTRLFIKRWFGSDDACIVLALICTIALTAIVLLANIDYGWDRHVYDIVPTKIEPTLKIAMAAKIMFTSAATFTRLSLLCFYYRLIHDSGKQLVLWTIHANVALSIGIFVTFICLTIFQCHPIRYYWTFGSPAGSCMDEGKVTLAAGIINLIADLFCTVLPIPMVIKLQMPKRQRIAVVLLLSAGFIVVIAGIVRTWFIYQSLVVEYDLTWYSFPLWIAAAVEIDLGVICASAPVLRPLLSKLSFSLSAIRSQTLNSGPSSALRKPHSASESTVHATTQRWSYHKTYASPKTVFAQNREELAHYPTSGNEYELAQWAGISRGNRPISESMGGSQTAILGSEDGDGHAQVPAHQV